MGKQTISVLVEGGKASAGPPIGNQLGPLGVNVKAIVDKINEKTKGLSGMQVPVKINIDTSTKAYDIEVGTPPAAALIKKELKLEKGSGEAGISRVGDLTEEQVRKIAIAKFGSDDPKFVSQIKGTCRSMGVTIGQGAVTKEEIKAREMKKKAAEEAAAKPAEGAAEGEPAKEEKLAGKEKSKEAVQAKAKGKEPQKKGK